MIQCIKLASEFPPFPRVPQRHLGLPMFREVEQQQRPSGNEDREAFPIQGGENT